MSAVARNHRDAILSAGGVIDSGSGVPLHFGDPAAELRAALDGCVLADRSDLSCLVATGPDLLDLLHRLSTGDVKSLGPGAGASTVLTTGKGRIVERLFVHVLDEARVLLVAGRGRGAAVLEHLNRYTFAEQTGLAEPDGDVLFTVSGPLTDDALAAAELPRPEPFGTRHHVYEGNDVHLLGHDGYGPSGVAVFAPRDAALGLWQGLTLAASSVDGLPAGYEAVEAARILRGLPAAGHELTEDFNPLEAGLWDAVSFDKGCYVGQEVVARLRTYDKVSRALVGLELPADAAAPEVGAELSTESAAKIGRVTSAVVPPGWKRPVALALVKRREAGPGDRVQVRGTEEATIVELPFAAER